jgi:hypothetical protein
MIYTITTDNPNALAEYFRLSGSCDDIQIAPFVLDGRLQYSVTLANPALDHQRFLKDISIYRPYNLSPIQEVDYRSYRIWEDLNRYAADLSGKIFAVVSKDGGAVEGLAVFGCMPWDNIPVSKVNYGTLAGQWLASIWMDKPKISMSGVLKASLFDFSLRPLNNKKGTLLQQRNGQLVLLDGPHETHILFEVKRFEP